MADFRIQLFWRSGMAAPEEDDDSLAELNAALANRVESEEDAIRFLDALEGIYNYIMKTRPPELDAKAIAGWENYMMTWAHRNAAMLPAERYRATIERVEVREPLGWTRRLFELSPLHTIARYIREIDGHPPGVTDPLSTHPDFQPLVEIELLDTASKLRTSAGIADGDRLVVHIGTLAYPGALVIVSHEPDPNQFLGLFGQMIARVLAPPTEEHGLLLRFSEDGDEGVAVIPSGVMNVECVIFNRPDVMSGRSAQ